MRIPGRKGSTAGRRLVFAALLLALASRVAAAQDFAEQWCRYEKSLVTARDYQTNDNPYRKILLSVTFTPRAGTCSGSMWCSAFTVPGFWDGGKVFKIRGTFPPGTWDWSATCSGASNGNNCATDPALDSGLDASQATTTATGTVVVSNGPGQCDPAQTRTYDLLEKGLPRISTNTSGLKSLTYGDGVTPYHWRADTTWKAPITEIKDPANTVNGVFNPLQWKQFLDNRRDKEFNTLLIAVASSADDPATGTQWLFEDIGTSCTGATWPKSCSRWRPLKYWRQYDEIVKLANDRGFLVVITAVMDPLGNPNSGTPLYPDPADARIFARNLAARMAGSHVLFSPSLDDKWSLTSTLIDQVGTELDARAPRHLLTAHLAGRSGICDYALLQDRIWHDIHLFQSGHALKVDEACPELTQSETDSYECATYRARMMPDWLAPNPTSMPPNNTCGITTAGLTPVKPNGNAEAAYDEVANPTSQTINSAYGVRHTGYATGLNGSFAVTLGVKGIYDWSNPSNQLETDGALHLKILNNQFKLSPWQMLQRRTQRIKNQPSVTEQDKFMIMAATLDSKFAMIYMPNNAEVRFDGSFLVGFDCSRADLGGWNITWINPRSEVALTGGTCANISDLSGATRKITRPGICDPNLADRGGCDLLVKIRKTGFYGSSLVPPSNTLDAWTEPAEGGWRLAGRTSGEVFELSPPTLYGRMAKSPIVAREADGAFAVAWEAESGDEQSEILLRRVDGQGRLLDHEYTVNLTHPYDQTNPWLATHPAVRGGVVAWASYAQDGDSVGIFARLVNPAGVPYGEEISVNEATEGRQDFPEVIMLGDGSFVVAWTSEGQDGDAEGVYARRFDPKGRPLGPEVQVNETASGAQWLSALEPESEGGFRVTWTGYGPDGLDRGVFARSYDKNGNALGEEQLVVPPPGASEQAVSSLRGLTP